MTTTRISGTYKRVWWLPGQLLKEKARTESKGQA